MPSPMDKDGFFQKKTRKGLGQNKSVWKLNNLSQVTKPENGRTAIWTQVCLTPKYIHISSPVVRCFHKIQSLLSRKEESGRKDAHSHRVVKGTSVVSILRTQRSHHGFTVISRASHVIWKIEAPNSFEIMGTFEDLMNPVNSLSPK